MNMPMIQAVAQDYLTHLHAGDLAAILSLFTPDAQVHSPLYGQRPATDFYTELFADTRRSELTHLDTLTNETTRTAALYFEYNWLMANGQEVVFPCVDILHFTEAGKIATLKIIYDTVVARTHFATLKQT